MDEILSHIYYSNVLSKFGVVRPIIKYHKLYSNYLHVLVSKLRNRYPIEAKLRNGEILLLRNKLEAQLYGGLLDGFEYDTNNDIVTLPCTLLNRKEQVKIHGGIRNGDIMSIFIESIYDQLPIDKKIVIDIGANIADSCIYFVLRGAYKPIGLEPFPKKWMRGVCVR